MNSKHQKHDFLLELQPSVIKHVFFILNHIIIIFKEKKSKLIFKGLAKDTTIFFLAKLVFVKFIEYPYTGRYTEKHFDSHV